MRKSTKILLSVSAAAAILIGGGLFIRSSAMADEPAQQAAALYLNGPFASRPLGKLLRKNVKRMRRLRGELNVTDQQKKQIGEVLLPYKPEIIDLAKRFQTEKKKMQTLVTADTVDESAIRAQADELAGLIGDAAVLRAKIGKKIRPILSEEQGEAIRACRSDCNANIDAWLQEISGK